MADDRVPHRPRASRSTAGRTIPKPTFLQLIEAISTAWRDRRGELDNNVVALRDALGPLGAADGAAAAPDEALIPAAVDAITGTFDPDWGGFGAAPKFPSTMALDLILAEVLHLGVAAERHAALSRRPCRRRSTRWRPAVSTTTSAAGSPATRSTSAGSCRTSRRCSTTRPCSSGCTPTRRRRRAPSAGGRSSPKRSSTCSVICASRAADSRRPRTPTPPVPTVTTTKGCSTRGRRARSPTWLAPTAARRRASSTTSRRRATSRGSRSIPNRIGRWPGDWQRPPDDRSSPPGAVRRPQRRARARASTTRCSPSGTP